MKRKKQGRESAYCRYIKRILDICFSFLLLFFLLLPIFLIAVIIRSDSNGKAIFKQKRMGRGGKIFVCYKFRTMYSNAPHQMPSADFNDREKYITRIGRLLRRTSLDELPQLLNVLKGDMSLVGPRPLICEETEIHRLRMNEGVYSIRPGMTGMAQVSGRNLLGNEEKLERDAYYLQNIKMKLDVKILFDTFVKVCRGDGINGASKQETNK